MRRLKTDQVGEGSRDIQQHYNGAEPLMSYAEFFRERQQARYACERGRFRGCC